MNILITGAAGALGRNLVENLKAIRDGKNQTRPNFSVEIIYEYDKDNKLEELEHFCTDCDFIVHAAGVKVVRIIQSYVGVVNKVVWRKSWN